MPVHTAQKNPESILPSRFVVAESRVESQSAVQNRLQRYKLFCTLTKQLTNLNNLNQVMAINLMSVVSHIIFCTYVYAAHFSVALIVLK